LLLILLFCLLLQRKLMERNVAEEIAGKVVDSVAQSLEGQKLSSFTGGLRS
jgi:signal recognition particle receptor subunit alpha